MIVIGSNFSVWAGNQPQGLVYSLVSGIDASAAFRSQIMPANTAPSGNSEQGPLFDTHAFIKAFVAGLVLRDRRSIRPYGAGDRRGFAQVIRLLDMKIDELEQDGADITIIRQLVRIANDLRASNTGGYEGFETALRGLQLTFASCPNPFYEEIAFSVPRPYAETTVDSLPPVQRDLVKEVAEAFLQEAGR
jgi:hypothetical protein